MRAKPRPAAERCPKCGSTDLAPMDSKPDEQQVACNGCELYFDPTLLVGYKLTIDGGTGWMFAGTTPGEVAETLRNEVESHEGLEADEIDGMHLESFEITQYEIDNMPEFPGW